MSCAAYNTKTSVDGVITSNAILNQTKYLIIPFAWIKLRAGEFHFADPNRGKNLCLVARRSFPYNFVMPGPFIERHSETTLEEDKKDSYFVTNSQLFKTRVSFLVAISGYIIYEIIQRRSRYFYYLTDWNWLLNFVYFLVAIILSSKRFSGRSSDYFVFKYFYACTVCLSWVVTVVFWGFIVTNQPFEVEEVLDVIPLEVAITGTISHLLNIILPLIDLTRII